MAALEVLDYSITQPSLEQAMFSSRWTPEVAGPHPGDGTTTFRVTVTS